MLHHLLIPAGLVAGMAAGSAAAADAPSLADSCFAARYGTDYLAAHPGQRVAAISMSFQEFDKSLLVGVIYKLRYGPSFGFSGACYTKVRGGFLCEACVSQNCQASGGQFVVGWSGGNTVHMVNDLTGVLAKNAAGGRDYLAAGGGDGELVLQRAAPDQCGG